MKKLICLLVAIIMACFAVFPAFASSKEIAGISFVLGEEYQLFDDSTLLPESDVEGLVFVAISNDGKHQIQCRCTETEFSKQIGSFEGLDSKTVIPAAEKLFEDGFETVVLNSTLYLKSVTSNGENDTAIYATVSKNKLFTFTYFGPDVSKIGEFMGTVTLPKNQTSSSGKVLTIVLICIFILADIIFLVFIIFTFVKDYKQIKMEREENIVSHYIKIKRRRY